jgi:hypothetical protein
MELNNNFLAVTNNEYFCEKYPNVNIDRLDNADIRDVFVKVRDYVHKGHRILSHPLSGSVKPNETLIKTVFVTKNPDGGAVVDEQSIKLIENAIMACDKFYKRDYIYPNAYDDFKLVDLGLAESALTGIRGY